LKTTSENNPSGIPQRNKSGKILARETGHKRTRTARAQATANKTNFASSTNASEKFFFKCRLGATRVFPPEISGIRGAALQFNQTIQLRNTKREGQSFANILWNGIFCERLTLNLTTSGAADTVGANCVAQGFSRGYTESGLRLSWSSCEHRQSDHPSPYYGMRKAKFARNGADGYFDESVMN
jgi:hypothetical protein